MTNVDPELQTWRFDAACKGKTRLFFPPRDIPDVDRQLYLIRARDLCASCPVIDQCREYAHSRNERWGVWAGEDHEGRAGGYAREMVLHPHGTDERYRQELLLGEDTCDACRDAHSRLVTARKQAQRASWTEAEYARRRQIENQRERDRRAMRRAQSRKTA